MAFNEESTSFSGKTLLKQISSTESSILHEHQQNEPRPGAKNLSPGMKVLVRNHIKNAIDDIRSHLEEFVSFVNEIQQKVPSEWEMVTISPLQSPSTPSSCSVAISPPLRRPYPERTRARNAALRDAFYVARKILMKICKLLNEMAFSANPEDEEELDSESPHFDLYYAQYVLQLSSFLLRMFGESLNKFSENLKQEAMGNTLEGAVGQAASIEGKISIDSFPSYSYVHMKNHKICPESKKCNLQDNQIKPTGHTNNQMTICPNLKDAVYFNEDSQLSTENKTQTRPIQTVPGTSTTYHRTQTRPIQTVPGTSTTYHRTRITDALELLIFLSNKMLLWLQDPGLVEYKAIQNNKLPENGQHTCRDCKMKLSQVDICESCRELLHTNHIKKEASFSNITTETASGKQFKCTDCYTDQNISSSQSGSEVSESIMEKQSLEHIHINGIFNVGAFSDQLKTEFTQYVTRKCCRVSDCLEPSSILDIVLQSFLHSSLPGRATITRKLIEEQQTKITPKDAKIKPQHLVSKKDKTDQTKAHVEAKKPHLTIKEKDLDNVVRKFIDESLKIAVKNVKVIRQLRKTAAIKASVDKDKKVDLRAKYAKALDKKFQQKLMSPLEQSLSKTVESITEPKESTSSGTFPKTFKTSPTEEGRARSGSSPTVPVSVIGILQKPSLSADTLHEPTETRKEVLVKPSEWSTETIQESLSATSKEDLGERLCKEGLLPKGCTSCPFAENFMLSDVTSAESLSPPKEHVWKQSAVSNSSQNRLPPGKAEIREIDAHGEVEITLIDWNDEQDPQDERWERNVLKNITLVKVTQPTGSDEEHTSDVRYELRKKGPRASVATTHLNIIKEVGEKHATEASDKETDSIRRQSSAGALLSEIQKNGTRKKSSSDDSLSLPKGRCVKGQIGEESKKRDSPRKEIKKFDLVNKLWRFYDDLRKNLLCTGPPLILKVRENFFLNDAFELLMMPSEIPLNHYRFIKAYFTYRSKLYDKEFDTDISELEDQTDDFWEHVVEKLFSADHKSLFDYPSEESKFLYPNPVSHSHPEWFHFAGVILALSILHQQPLRVKLPLCFFKCLLDRPLKLDDLQEIDPLLHQRLTWMKDNDLSTRKKPVLFTVSDRLGGASFEYNLDTEKNTFVTEGNKYRYIESCLKWKLAKSCLEQLKEIRRGFISVLDPKLLSNFSEEELQLLCYKPLDDIASCEDVSLDEFAPSKASF